MSTIPGDIGSLDELRDRFGESSDCIVAFSDSGEIVYANGAAQRLLGIEIRTHAQLPGIHVATLASPAADGDDPQEMRRFSTADRARPRTRLFDAVFEHTPAALLVVDDERRLLAANRSARRTFGITRKATTERELDELIAPPHGTVDGLWKRALEEGRMSVRAVANTAGGTNPVVLRMHTNIVPGRHLCMAVPSPQGIAAAEPPDEPRLSAREREILSGLAAGERSHEIAERLFLSAETVRTHVRNAMRKLEARSRVHAVIVALRRGELNA